MSNLKTLKPFKKGEDSRRNLKGRPKGTSDFRERLQQEVNKKVMVNGEEVTLEMALMLNLLIEARKGKFWATKLVMNYLYGKPRSMCPGCERRRAEEEEMEAQKNDPDFQKQEKLRIKKKVEQMKKFQAKWFPKEPPKTI